MKYLLLLFNKLWPEVEQELADLPKQASALSRHQLWLVIAILGGAVGWLAWHALFS